jgi:hypothetical protein
MSIIEITAEQAEQFRAAGIRVRYAIHPSDLALPASVIDVTPQPVIKRVRGTTRKFTQVWRKGTWVRLSDNHQDMLDRYSDKNSKLYDVYQAVALLLNERNNAPMLRHKLWHATNKFLGKKYTGTSTTLTKMLRSGFLITVQP